MDKQSGFEAGHRIGVGILKFIFRKLIEDPAFKPFRQESFHPFHPDLRDAFGTHLGGDV